MSMPTTSCDKHVSLLPIPSVYRFLARPVGLETDMCRPTIDRAPSLHHLVQIDFDDNVLTKTDDHSAQCLAIDVVGTLEWGGCSRTQVVTWLFTLCIDITLFNS